MGDVGG
jgi:hypothetical protein